MDLVPKFDENCFVDLAQSKELVAMAIAAAIMMNALIGG
jgi:hypothetical protein